MARASPAGIIHLPRGNRSTPASTIQSSVLILLFYIRETVAIGCFVCSSFNGTNPSCEDPFNSSLSLHLQNCDSLQPTEERPRANYQHPCWSYKKERAGLFPADHCIKINGVGDRGSMVIRTCALDSGSLTADTEIVRISHCGHFKFEGQSYSGCVQSCDSDGCNHAASSLHNHLIFIFMLLICFRYQNNRFTALL